MTRSKRAALTFISNGFLTLITLLTGFVAARLLVRWLGAETLGLFATANGWIGQLAILEMGVGGAMLPLLARAASRGNEAEIRDALSASFRAYRRIAGASLLGAAVVVVLITRLMVVPDSRVIDVRFGLVVGAMSLFLLPLSPLRALVESSQRGYVISIVLVVQSLLITALSLLFAYCHCGVTGQFLAVACGGIPFYVALVVDARRTVRGLRSIFFQDPSPGSLAELRKLNRPSIICGISGRLGLYTDNLLIGYFFGPAVVVPFMYTQKLAVLVQGQLQAVGGATWAALAELHVAGNQPLFNRRVAQLTRLVVTLGIAAAIPIIVYNRFFFRLWQPRLEFGGQALTFFASMNAIALALMTLWGWVFSGTGKLDYAVPSALAGSIVNLLVSFLVTQQHWLCGPVFGSFIGMGVVQLVWRPWEMRRAFGSSVAALYLAVVVPLLLAVPFVAAALAFERSHPPQGWLGLCAAMAISALPYTLAAWFLLFGNEERSIILYRIRVLIRRNG